MKLLIDINLSPQWVEWLKEQGYASVHWSEVGDPRAPDPAILAWAREHEHVVFTHDLDFSRILSLTHSHGPSVLQVRTKNVLPSSIGQLVVQALRHHGDHIRAGAIIVVDADSSRARILPVKQPLGEEGL